MRIASLGLKKRELGSGEGTHGVLGELRSSDGDKQSGSQKNDKDRKHAEVKEGHSWMSLLSIQTRHKYRKRPLRYHFGCLIDLVCFLGFHGPNSWRMSKGYEGTLRTMTGASLGAGRNCEDAFIRLWPCGKERIQDGEWMLAVEQKPSRPVAQSAGKKASRDSDIQKRAPEKMARQNF